MMDDSYAQDVGRLIRHARVVAHSQMLLTVGRALRLNGHTESADWVTNNVESLMAYASLEEERVNE